MLRLHLLQIRVSILRFRAFSKQAEFSFLKSKFREPTIQTNHKFGKSPYGGLVQTIKSRKMDVYLATKTCADCLIGTICKACFLLAEKESGARGRGNGYVAIVRKSRFSNKSCRQGCDACTLNCDNTSRELRGMRCQKLFGTTGKKSSIRFHYARHGSSPGHLQAGRQGPLSRHHDATWPRQSSVLML